MYSEIPVPTVGRAEGKAEPLAKHYGSLPDSSRPFATQSQEDLLPSSGDDVLVGSSTPWNISEVAALEASGKQNSFFKRAEQTTRRMNFQKSKSWRASAWLAFVGESGWTASPERTG